MRANLFLSLCVGFSFLGQMGLERTDAAAFQNGDFEIPSESGFNFIPLNIYYNGPNGVINPITLPGWTSTTTADTSTSEQNFLITSSFQTIPHGLQALLFNGDGVETTTLSQTFDTISGAEYDVQFELTAQTLGINDDGDSYVASHLLAQASGAGNPQQSYLATGIPNSNGVFPVLSDLYQFTAQSPETTLTFTQSDGGTISPILDDVQVQELPLPRSVFPAAAAGAALLIRRKYNQSKRDAAGF